MSTRHVLYVGIRALERSILHCVDDAEEVGNDTSFGSSDLELVEDPDRQGSQTVGLRFRDIAVPRGARIKAASLQFTAYGSSRAPAELIVQAEAAANAAGLTASGGLRSRTPGSSSVRWRPEPWERDGERLLPERTPDLSAVVAEVIARPDWLPGNTLVFLIHGSGNRVAKSCDGASAVGQEPALSIEYEPMEIEP
jgi:hypothetical protein